MQPLVFIFIVFAIVAFLGIGLFYVGSKLLYNVSSDVANEDKPTTSTTSSSNGPGLPTIPTGEITTNTFTTTPLPPDTIECWSKATYQGNKKNGRSRRNRRIVWQTKGSC